MGGICHPRPSQRNEFSKPSPQCNMTAQRGWPRRGPIRRKRRCRLPHATPSSRFDQRHRASHRAGPRQGRGPRVVINGFGKPGDRARARRTRDRVRGQGDLLGRRHDQAGPDRRHDPDAKAKLGSVDILINNAGVQFVSPIEDFPVEKWDQIIAINLSAAFHAMRAAIPGMKAAKWGRIISTASAHSLGRLAVQVGLCHRQARHRRPHQDRGAGDSPHLGLRSTRFSPVTSGRRWWSSQIPDTMKARGLTREQVINDVMLAAQPTKQFVTVRTGRRDRRLSLLRRRLPDHRRQPLGRRRLDGGVSHAHRANAARPACR